MREMKIDRWCDLCHADDKDARVPATRTFLVDIRDLGARPLGRKGRAPEPRVVEVCDTHGDTIAFMARRATVGVTAERFGSMTALAEDKNLPAELVVADRTAPSSPREDQDDRGPCPVPGCGEVVRHAGMVRHLLGPAHRAMPIAQPKKCPDCPHKAATAVGMIVHRRSAHDYDYHAELAARARPPAVRTTRERSTS